MKTRPRFPLLTTAIAGLAAVLIVGCNKPQPMEAATPAPATTAGTEIDDSVLTGSVMSAFLADPGLKSFDLKVETRKGVVQLSGMVDDQAQIDNAVVVARGVTGVLGVENHIGIKGASTTVGDRIDDAVVTTKVKGALLAHADVRSLDIGVVTSLGIVQLSGFVDNQGQVDRAAEVAGGVEGAQRIDNRLSVKQ